MANALFYSARDAFLGQQALIAAPIDLNTNTIKIALFDATDTPIPAVATMWNMGQPGAGWAPVDPFTNGPTLTSPTIGADVALGPGVFDAADTVFTALPANDAMDYLVMFKALTSMALSPMIAFWDTFSSGMPGIVPNGGNITVQWHGNGILGI